MRFATLLLATVVTVVPGLAAAQVPANAHRVPGQGRWSCDDGFLRRGSRCVPVASISNAEIRKLLITVSIAMYSGNCPCPYNVDRGGRACGRRSAYSRPGGRTPLCYDSDVTDEAVSAFREQARSWARKDTI
jgi:hypothetical protein